MTHLEMQRGKVAMKKEEFYPEVGATAACTLRALKAVEYCGTRNKERQIAKEQEVRHLLVCDSWFGSVKAVENAKLMYRVPKTNGPQGEYDLKICRERGQNPNGHEIIGAVKTNTGSYPKKQIDKIMRHWPSGSYLVLECRTPDTKVDLVAIGYKYNSKKVLCFIMSKNAGSTAPGKPYIAKFPDKHGNVQERRVTRPEILSLSFGCADAIDSHNHCRQFRLGLERLWLTRNPWFRLNCTIVGMTVVDAFRCLKYYHLGNFKGMTVAEFADGLAHDCVYNPFRKDREERRAVPSAASLEPDCIDVVKEQMKDQFAALLEQSGIIMNQNIELFSTACQQSLPTSIRMERAPRESNGSTLTEETPSLDACIDIGIHELKAVPMENNRNRRRKYTCVICKGKNNKTIHFCDHPVCQRMHPNGCFICNPSSAKNPIRNTEAVGGDKNTLTCLQIHQNQFREMKLEEYRNKIKQRAQL